MIGEGRQMFEYQIEVAHDSKLPCTQKKKKDIGSQEVFMREVPGSDDDSTNKSLC